MVVGGGTEFTNINNNKTQQLEFEVVTGCSLSPRQDTEGLSTEEEGSHRLSPVSTAETAPLRPVTSGIIDGHISNNNSD